MTHFEKLSFCGGGNLLSCIHIVNVCRKQKVVGFGFFRPTYMEVWFKCISYVTRRGLEPITKRTLNHLTCMAEWLSVRLWTNWLWVRVPLQSLNLKVALVSNKKFLGIQAITLDSLKARMWHDKIHDVFPIHAFCISNTFISNAPGWNWQKIKQKLSNTLWLNFCYLKIIYFLHPCYHPKIIGDVLNMYETQGCQFWLNYMINGNENEAENEK